MLMIHETEIERVVSHGTETVEQRPEYFQLKERQNGKICGRVASTSSSGRPLQILCVDDEAIGTGLLAELLRTEGHVVEVSLSPWGALQLDLLTFNLAIVDFEMPGMNGRELLLRIRALGARFPVVLRSGQVSFLSHQDRVLFSSCIDKAEPIDRLLNTIADFTNLECE